MKVNTALRSRDGVYTPATDTTKCGVSLICMNYHQIKKIFQKPPIDIKQNKKNKKCICQHSINKLRNSRFEVQIATILMILDFLGIYHVLVVIT
jgi:hypothetical protein